MLVRSIQFCPTRSYPIVSCSYPGCILTGVGGDEGIRTPGLRLAKAALSQLSYIPKAECLNALIPSGMSRPPTSRFWWAFQDSNLGPFPYQRNALTN